LSPSRRARQNATSFQSHSNLERTLKVYQIILLLWVIVFAFWLVKQFSEHNKRSGR
jgi:flagellar biogenesis protein FliO